MQFVKSFTNGRQSSAVTALEYFYLRLSSATILIYLPFLSLPLSLSVFFSCFLSLCPCGCLLSFPCCLHFSSNSIEVNRKQARSLQGREMVGEGEGGGEYRGDCDCSVCLSLTAKSACQGNAALTLQPALLARLLRCVSANISASCVMNDSDECVASFISLSLASASSASAPFCSPPPPAACGKN